MEMHFCRRCGAATTAKTTKEQICANGHHLFITNPPAIALFLVNPKKEVLLVTRGIEPGKGMLDAPGGFLDLNETLEHAVAREIREELHVEPSSYGPLQFLCSGINDYMFDGEMSHPIDAIFWATAPADLVVRPDDDASAAGWHALATLDLEKLAFKSIRTGIGLLKKRLV